MFISAWEAAFQRTFEQKQYEYYFECGNILYSIFDGDVIAAGYCLFPISIYFDGFTRKGALCNNVFVRPEYEGKNLFVRLGRYALEDAGQKKIELVIGMPNDKSLAGHKRVGWTFQDDIGFLYISREHLEMNAIANVTCEIEVLSKDGVFLMLGEIEALSRAQSIGRTFSVIKTREYFDWRYLQRSHTKYYYAIARINDELVGYCVFKYFSPKKTLHIIDLEAKDDTVVIELIRSASEIELDISNVNIWSTTSFANKLIECGFRMTDEKDKLIAIIPGKKQKVYLGNGVNIVLGDTEVY